MSDVTPRYGDPDNTLLFKIASSVAAGGGGGGGSGVASFNARTGAVTLQSADVTTALGFTPGNVASPLSQFALTTSAQLLGIISDAQGIGFLVFNDGPVLIAPTLGTPISGNLANCTGYPVANLSGLAAGVATFLATPSSANLATAVTDETGSGALVFATSPTLVTPALGTPTSGVLTSCTGYTIANISGLGANVATFLATPSSANLAAAVTGETGTGALVFGTAPFFTTSVGVGRSSLGTTTAAGLQALNLTAATAILTQVSPSLQLSGAGWKTNAPAGSRSVDWRIYTEPITGAANPTANLLFEFSVNAGAFANILNLTSGGLLTLGGTTSSFPALGRNGTSFEVLGADGAGPSGLQVYNTKTSSTNYERLDVSWSGNVCSITSTKGSGGGTARELRLNYDGQDGISLQNNQIVLGSAIIVESANIKATFFTDLLTLDDNGGQKIGFFGAAAAVVQEASTIVNNVASGGTSNQIDDFSGAVYATDGPIIAADIYQLARKLKQIVDGLRLYGLFIDE